MSEPVITFPAPQLEAPSPASKWEMEYRAFLGLLPELLRTHPGQYVAIHEGRVVDAGPNELALLERVFGRLGNVSVHVGLVTDREPVARLPHYRSPQGSQA